MEKKKKRKKTGGRITGSVNKATATAREAIAQFVDGNSDKLVDWLEAIAKGKKTKKGDYIVNPDPKGAFDSYMKVVEYHVPKLARIEPEKPPPEYVEVLSSDVMEQDEWEDKYGDKIT
jgi:hypothetical protein